MMIKKSQGFEAWFFVIAALLAFALVFVILNKAWGSIKPEIDSGLQSSLEGHEYSNANFSEVLNDTTETTQLFDKLIPFLIIGLFGFVMLMAGAIIRHPIMIFVGIIILGVAITLAVIFANIYNTITSSDEFADTKADMPIQDKFMKFLPVIVFLMGIGVAAMIIVSKSNSGGGL